MVRFINRVSTSVVLMFVAAACSSPFDSADTCIELAQFALDIRGEPLAEDDYVRYLARIDQVAGELDPNETAQRLGCEFAAQLIQADDPAPLEGQDSLGIWALVGLAVMGLASAVIGVVFVRRIRSRGPALQDKNERFGENPIDVWRPPG